MYNNFSSKKTKKVISALLASALVVTSAPITANAATAKVLGVGKTFTLKKTTKVSGLSKAEKKIVKVTVNKKKRTVTVKGLKAGKATFKIGKKAYTVKVGATKIAKKTLKTTMTAGTSQTVSVTATAGKGDTIKFASSNKAVLTVNKASAKASTKGIAKMGVKAVKEGTAKLTVSSKNTGVKKAFTIKVVAAQPAPTQAPTVVSTPGITTPTATVAATKAPSVVTTPGVTAPGTTNAPGTTDAAQTPGTDATQVPGTDATQAPGTDATQVPGTDQTQNPDATQTPDAPIAETGTITVTTNVTGASIKVISGTSVVAEATTDATTTSATFADLANGTYTIEVTKDGYATFTTTQIVAGDATTVNAKLDNAKVVSVKAKSKSEILVKFNAPVDAVSAENFKVEGATVKNATLSADKQAATVEVSNMTMGKEYKVTVTGLTSKGVALADAEITYEAKEVQYGIKLSLANDKTTLYSDGKDAVLVTATIYDEDGDVADYLDKVEVEFKTTAGNFAETRVTVQNGKATNMLTSEASTKDIEALISATVVSTTDDYKNILNKTDSRIILMSPDIADAGDETVGATLVDVKVETADRIILYFNKNVDVADYTEQDTTTGEVFTYDDKKMKIEILDNADNNENDIPAGGLSGNPKERIVRALARVEGNSKALCAILEVNDPANHKKALTDNSKVVVKVTDNRDGSVETHATKSTLVSDIRVPSILGVENDGLRTLKVTFSEPVQTTDGGGADYVANDPSHWRIDGTALNNDKYGVAGSPATVEVGEFNKKTGDDERNIVTITLGEDEKGKPLYFTSGEHSIQGNKIGDWANLTDPKNNIINTQTLNFTIDPDNTIPTAEVKVESPEQYTVTFNKPVSKKEVVDNLVMQVWDTTASKWVDQYTAVGTLADAAADGSNIVVTAVDEKDGLAKEYVVEVTQDWTVALKTSTEYVNYYNNSYRLYVDAKKISNPSNGLLNAEITLDLNDDIMKKLDATSPEIVVDGVNQVGTKNQFEVTMSEPVQLANLTTTEVITPSQTQKQVTNGVQLTTITFVSEDEKTTVPGKVEKMTDAHDTKFVVSPTTGTLAPGTWRIVITGLSDDYGNTIATRSDTTFEVKGVTETVDTSFKVQWIVAVPQSVVDNGNATNDPIGKAAYNDETDDIIYVKFNKRFKTSGGAANAVSTTNYTVNGYAVPTTSKIDASVKGYNDIANKKTGYTDLVAIHLTAGTLNADSNTVNISKTIEAYTGGTLSNYGATKLDKDTATGIFTYNYKALDGTASPANAAELDTVDEIKKVLANSDYVDVKLPNITAATAEVTKAATTDLKISSVGKYDFNAANTTVNWKSLTINTKETGRIDIIAGNFGEVSITAPNADVYLNGTQIKKTTIGGVACTGNLNVYDVLEGTLVLETGTVVGGDLVVYDNNDGCSLDTSAVNVTGKVVINTTGYVQLKPNSSEDVEIKKATNVRFEAAPTTISLATGVVAKDVTIGYDDTISAGMGTALSGVSGVNEDKVDTTAPTLTISTVTATSESESTEFTANIEADEDVTLSAPTGVTLDKQSLKKTTATDVKVTLSTATTPILLTAKDTSGNVKKYVARFTSGANTWAITEKTSDDVTLLGEVKTAFTSYTGNAAMIWAGTDKDLTITAADSASSAQDVDLPQSVPGKYTIEYNGGTAVTGFTLASDKSKVTVGTDVTNATTYDVNYKVTSATDGSTIEGKITITATKS